jgi:hypothetical protein
MKKTTSKKTKSVADEMRREFDFDYTQTGQSGFAKTKKEDRIEEVLDSELSEVFKTPGPVRKVLRALFTTMPKT